MLHKRHNSVVTLAILLTLVGVSKPAKAFLLAQSTQAPTTFTVPDQLSEDAAVKIAASNSTDSINASLKESFAAKYPQAEVGIETQDSSVALNSVAEGQADLAAIGRNLTTEEKDQGFTAVPVSREKIAIIISANNPYDGNLTIEQFAQIFRGEITNWSDIGGAPGAIELVDLPDSNDTRQAFPNYPVFQSAEFSTGDTATQIEEDSTEAAIAQLGENSISYAVANDVIGRDDVKIVTMHTTQPDDPRYPFSQPFNLIYQGEPSEAAQAYLGFATGEGGQGVVANRVGSVSTAAISPIATGAAGLANQNGAAANIDAPASVEGESGQTADVNSDGTPDLNTNIDPDSEAIAGTDTDGEINLGKISGADADGVDLEVDADAEPGIIGGVDADSNVETDSEIDLGKSVGTDAEADADLDGEADPEAIAGADVDGVDVNPDADIEASADADIDGVDVEPGADLDGEADSEVIANADADLDGSGEVNSDLEGSGEANADLDGSGDVSADLDGSGEVNTELEGSGEVNTDLDGSGELNPELEGSGEPLSSDIEGVESEGEVVVPNDGVEETEVAAKNGGKWWLLLIPLLAIPILGAILFGGRKRSDQEPAVDNVPNVNSPNGGIDVPGMSGGGGVPPVGANVSTNLGNVAENSVDTASGIGAAGLAAGGAAIAGGAAAANLAARNRRVENSNNLDLDLDLNNSATVEEIPSTPVNEFSGEGTDLDLDLNVNRDLQIEDTATARLNTNLDRVDGVAVPGLDVNINNDLAGEATVDRPDLANAELDIDPNQTEFVEPNADLGNINVDGSLETDGVANDGEANTEFLGDFVLPEEDKNIDISVTNDLDTPDVNVDGKAGTGLIDGVTAAGGAAIAGGAAAASGLFNRGKDAVTDATGDVDLSVDTPEVDLPNVNTPDVDGNLDLNLGDRTNEIAGNVEAGIGELNAPNLDASVDVPDVNVSDVNLPEVNQDLNTDLNLEGGINTPELDLSANVDTPDVNVNGGTGTGLIGGITAAGGAAIAGGAAAASGLFNRGKDAVTDATGNVDLSVDTPDVDVPEVNPDVNADLNLEGGINTPELDLSTNLDTPDVNVDGGTGTGLIGGITAAGGAAIAGGAAAASGLFNRGKDAVTDATGNVDLSVDTPDVDLPNVNTPDVDGNLDLNLGDRTNEMAGNVEAGIGELNAPNLDANLDTNLDVPDVNVPDVNLPEVNQDLNTDLNLEGGINTPEVDLSANVDTPDVNVEGGTGTGLIDGVTAAGGAAIAGGAAAASGLFNRDQGSSDIQEFETFETSFDTSATNNPTSFADKVIGDAETTAIDGGQNLQDLNLDSVANSAEINLDEIELNTEERTINASLEDISFDDLDSSQEINLDDIKLDDQELNLDRRSANDLSLDGKVEDVRLEDLGFAETSSTATEFSLEDIETTEVNNLADNQVDDMSNISEWLDSLETPNKDSDNISDWLDTLDQESNDADPNKISLESSETTTDLEQEADDISFQFLEDLLDRDADSQRNQ